MVDCVVVKQKVKWKIACRNFVVADRENVGLRRSLGHGARPFLAAVSYCSYSKSRLPKNLNTSADQIKFVAITLKTHPKKAPDSNFDSIASNCHHDG